MIRFVEIAVVTETRLSPFLLRMHNRSLSILARGLFQSYSLSSFPSHPSLAMNSSLCTLPFPTEVLTVSLTGFVWNIPVAFLLVATGSIAGESLLFLSFRHFFHSRIVQFRKEHEENYGTIVQVINQHKRWMVFLIRLSAIPVYSFYFQAKNQGHFSTPLFASIDEIEYREWLYMVIATSWKV